jgi:hypothetical protein
LWEDIPLPFYHHLLFCIFTLVRRKSLVYYLKIIVNITERHSPLVREVELALYVGHPNSTPEKVCKGVRITLADRVKDLPWP